MQKIIEKIPEIIHEAAQSPLGLLSLIIIALSLLAFAFFRNASVGIRVAIFVVIFIGAALFAGQAFRLASREPPVLGKAVPREAPRIYLFGNTDTHVLIHKMVETLRVEGYLASIGDDNRPDRSFYANKPDFPGNEEYYLRNQLEFNPNSIDRNTVDRIVKILRGSLQIEFDEIIEGMNLPKDRDISIVYDRK